MPDREPAATMTVEQAGALLGISRRAAYRAAAAGHIPVMRLGRRILVPTARLHHLLGITDHHDGAPGGPTPTVATNGARPATPDPRGRADVGSRYYVVSWADHHPRDDSARPATREYGSASCKQAAIRLAERVLPPGTDYIITTLHRTVHDARTPGAGRGLTLGR